MASSGSGDDGAPGPPQGGLFGEAPRPGVEWVEGQLTRVIWASADTGFALVKVGTRTGEITALGNLAVPASAFDVDTGAGPFLSLEGKWEEHAVHGRQFRVSGYLEGTPRTLDGLRAYLGAGAVPGVGPALASRIVDHFGLETPRVMAAEPHRIAEVKGIGEAKALAIAARWAEDEQGRALTILLRGLGLPSRTIDRIRRTYGERAGYVVAREPYRLAEEIRGVGFRTADDIARKQGLAEDDPARVRAAVAWVLEEAGSEGHGYLPRGVPGSTGADVHGRVAAVGVPTGGVDGGVEALVRAGRAVVEAIGETAAEDAVWSAELHAAECTVAHELQARITPGFPVLDAEVHKAETALGVELAPAQREAVSRALGGGLVVITGGPGTGKTTLVRVLLRVLSDRGVADRWKLGSPTGRAAKRLEEATGRSAQTLHRLLGWQPGGAFARHGGDPLDADGLVVDETSMVDLPLMVGLLHALPPPPFSLVLVGDADQLPSVGPGQILRDLVDSGVVPVVRLERVFRQGRDSGIREAAARIHAGQVPDSGEIAGYDDCYFLAREDADHARQTVVQVAAERLPAKGFDPRVDVQILAPTRRGPLGTEALNKALQERLNPTGEAAKRGDKELRVGDRVICTKNRYDVEVFNGDVGFVTAVGTVGIEIDFDGRVVPWGWDDLGMIELAYAITVHKAQGSEYPAVILALHPSHALMLRRNLFYTAVTRAKRFLCVVGSPRAWHRAVVSVVDRERNTRLAARLQAPVDVAELPLLTWEE